MKKMMLVVSCFVAFWVLGTPAKVHAEGSTNPVQTNSILRTAPILEEKTLGSGEWITFTVGGYHDVRFASKYKIKIKVDSKSRESIVVQRYGHYQYNPIREDSLFFFSNDITLNYSLVNDEIPGTRSGRETFYIINYSSTPLTIKAGITSGIHVKGQDEFFDDIDFCLE